MEKIRDQGGLPEKGSQPSPPRNQSVEAMFESYGCRRQPDGTYAWDSPEHERSFNEGMNSIM